MPPWLPTRVSEGCEGCGAAASAVTPCPLRAGGRIAWHAAPPPLPSPPTPSAASGMERAGGMRTRPAAPSGARTGSGSRNAVARTAAQLPADPAGAGAAACAKGGTGVHAPLEAADVDRALSQVWMSSRAALPTAAAAASGHSPLRARAREPPLPPSPRYAAARGTSGSPCASRVPTTPSSSAAADDGGGHDDGAVAEAAAGVWGGEARVGAGRGAAGAGAAATASVGASARTKTGPSRNASACAVSSKSSMGVAGGGEVGVGGPAPPPPLRCAAAEPATISAPSAS
jgi:hypothetical protein